MLFRCVIKDHPFLGCRSARGGGRGVVDGRGIAEGLYGYDEGGAGVDEKYLRERLNGRTRFNIVWGGRGGGGGGV